MVKENKALIRRWIDEVLTQGYTRRVDEIFAPNYVLHGPSLVQEVHGREGIGRYVATLRAASPDLRFTVEDQIAEGDKVVTRFRTRGTHQGELWGMPPTGKEVEITNMSMSRIEGGKMAEEWPAPDRLGMMQQLGLIPESAQAES